MVARTMRGLLTGALVAVVVGGCASPEEKAAKAQMQASEAELQLRQERLKLLEDYKKCINEAGSDTAKADACDRILKAIEALQ